MSKREKVARGRKFKFPTNQNHTKIIVQGKLKMGAMAVAFLHSRDFLPLDHCDETDSLRFYSVRMLFVL
jgi:hypothetical protein